MFSLILQVGLANFHIKPANIYIYIYIYIYTYMYIYSKSILSPSSDSNTWTTI